MQYYDFLETQCGWLRLVMDDIGLCAVDFVEEPSAPASWKADGQRLSPFISQFSEWFSGQRQQFDLPLSQHGTAFQRQVWQALMQIPYGTTCSYADIAERIGNPKAVRAVGLANGRNPLPIIVPCHRVIGRDGSLTGYAGGLERKRWLLAHEQTHPVE